MLPNDGRVVSNFIVQALLKKPLTIYGDGKQTRSFCYVEDLINGLIKLMNSEIDGPVNLGNPEEFKIIDLAKIIKEKTSSDQELVFKELPTDDPMQRKPIIKKANEKLGWYPLIKLNEGLNKTINYFSKELEI